jgi:inosine-uridine nucleoside N-ribohydrolase
MTQLSDDCFAFGGPMMSVDDAVAIIAARVSAVQDVETVSLVYGHRPTIHTTFYVGANFSRTRIADAAVKSYQTEIFAKGSFAFEFL